MSAADGSRDGGRAASPAPSAAARTATAVRYLLVTAVLVGAAGLVGSWLAWPLLTSTIGPTAYVFAAHPRSEAARFRNAAIGHGVAVGCGLGALVAFGLVHHPSVSALGRPSLVQVAAAMVAAGVTVLILEVAGSHHAPAAATALLIATGLARPGAPLIGLVLGLAVVIVLGTLIGRIPLARPATGDGDEGRSARPVQPRGSAEGSTASRAVGRSS